MQEEFLVHFDTPIDLQQISLVLRSSGVFAPDVEWLDAQRSDQYSQLLAPARSRTSGILQSILICVVTTILGLLSVIVENIGYALSLSAAIVVWMTLRRKEAAAARQIVSVRVDSLDAATAKSSLLQFGAAAFFGPIEA